MSVSPSLTEQGMNNSAKLAEKQNNQKAVKIKN